MPEVRNPASQSSYAVDARDHRGGRAFLPLPPLSACPRARAHVDAEPADCALSAISTRPSSRCSLLSQGTRSCLWPSDHLDPAVTDQSGVVPPSAVAGIYARHQSRSEGIVGPHRTFLTGPIFVNGAMPGDVLEVRILDVQLAIPYGYNQHRPGAGWAAERVLRRPFRRVIPLNMQSPDGRADTRPSWFRWIGPFLSGRWGVAPARRPWAAFRADRPGVHTGNLDNKEPRRGFQSSTCRCMSRVRCSRPATPMRRKAMARSMAALSRLACRGRFQFIVRKDMKLVWAARGDRHALDGDGDCTQKPRRGNADGDPREPLISSPAAFPPTSPVRRPT